jgi:Icc-related predicted phosphoesterase
MNSECEFKESYPYLQQISMEETKLNHTFTRNPTSDKPSACKVVGVYNCGGATYNTDQQFRGEIPPQPFGVMRIVCLSDTHETKIKNVPLGDVLVHAGDFTYEGQPDAVHAFNCWLGQLKHKHKIVIAGNHDVTFDVPYYKKNWTRYNSDKKDPIATKNLLTNCIYLEDSEVTIDGVRFWGSPWQPEFCNWAFNVKTEEEIRKYWDLIPVGVDVLLTHGPPKGHGGLCYDRREVGCPELLKAITERVKPALHVCGHIHEGYGVTTDGTTHFVNASSVNLSYLPTNQPIVVDLWVNK